MSEHRISAAPDYTNAALTMLGVNLFCAFLAIWALYGLLPVLLVSGVLNHAIDRLRARRR
ncbi:MAG: hypothetical protein ABJH07_04650 [Sedimentitalea sp.]|uniref:hypothetical protein n=1 Tax=Sedimentitalea sp. TaxID=2048915 RepID=UPI0032674968